MSEYSNRSAIIKLFAFGIIIVVIVGSLIAGLTMIKTVPTGFKGILVEWGDAKTVLDEGLHIISPIGQNVELINVQIQKVEATESAASVDLQEVSTTIAVNYRLKEAYILELFKNFRHNYESVVIIPNIEESLKAATAKYTATQLIANREDVKHSFLSILGERLDSYHIEVLAVSVTDFQFSPAFTAAIEQKVTAEQEAQAEFNKLKAVEYIAQQDIIKATAQANATITKAQGEANATLIAAEAQSEAIRLLQEQLANNPEYIEYLTVLAWNGELPIYMLGDSIPFIMLPEMPVSNSTSTP